MKNIISNFIKIIALLPALGLAQEQKSQEQPKEEAVNKIKEFDTRYQDFLQGDIIIFGNNIVNRTTSKLKTSDPYQDRARNQVLNDEQNMEYIDVDKDKKTFSSSSVEFVAPYKNTEIVWAGLYWSGIYPYEKGKIDRRSKTISAQDSKRNDFTEVLIKLPKQKKYTPVTGKIVFDGVNDTLYTHTKPYVAFADITDMFKKGKKIDGLYTIANVRAGKGTIYGGASAGWAIVLIYKDETASMKRIEVKDGFSMIGEKAKTIAFSDFQTPNHDPIITRLAGIALEADLNVGENKLAVRTSKAGIFLENDKRQVNNFFNSSITEEEDYYPGRTPDNTNTLGFDIFNMEIPNPKNSIVGPDLNFLNVDMTSTADPFYVFLMALVIDSSDKPVIVEKPLDEEKPKEEAPKTEEVKPEEKPKEEVKETPTEISTANMPTNTRKATIENVDKGFYTILAAFSTPENVDRYINSQKAKGLELHKLYYPEKKIHYAYFSHSMSYNDAQKKQIEIVNMGKEKPEFSNLKPWIFFVNN